MTVAQDTSASNESPASPCIKLCRIDEATGYCSGCWRTLAEITNWSTANDQEKRRILAALPQRQTAISPD